MKPASLPHQSTHNQVCFPQCFLTCVCVLLCFMAFFAGLIEWCLWCGESGEGVCANVSLSASGYFNDIKNKVV